MYAHIPLLVALEAHCRASIQVSCEQDEFYLDWNLDISRWATRWPVLIIFNQFACFSAEWGVWLTGFDFFLILIFISIIHQKCLTGVRLMKIIIYWPQLNWAKKRYEINWNGIDTWTFLVCLNFPLIYIQISWLIKQGDSE